MQASCTEFTLLVFISDTKTQKGNVKSWVQSKFKYILKVIFDLGLNGDPEISALNRIMNICC